jgi:hypothetical protein
MKKNRGLDPDRIQWIPTPEIIITVKYSRYVWKVTFSELLQKSVLPSQSREPQPEEPYLNSSRREAVITNYGCGSGSGPDPYYFYQKLE